MVTLDESICFLLPCARYSWQTDMLGFTNR